MKRCTKCGLQYPATNLYFRKQAKAKSGLQSWCKICAAEHHKQYREANKRIIAEHAKQYREEHKEIIAENGRLYYLATRDAKLKYFKQRHANNPEYRKQYYEVNKVAILEQCKQYHKTHKEAVAEYKKQWNENNPEARAAACMKWQKANPDKVNIINQRRRARKRQLPNTLTATQWDSIKKTFNNRCCYCGQELPLVQEHFIPLSKGGEYTINNILPSCKSCNNSKSAKVFETWYPTFKHYSKQRERKILKFLNYKKEIQQLSISM